MNKKESQQAIMVGVLIIFLLILFINTKNKMDKKKIKNADKGNVSEIKSNKTAKLQDIDLNAYFAADKEAPAINRDPFYKPSAVIQNNNTLNLIGIAQDNESSYAIINNIIVKKGSVIEGATVVDIQKNKVLLIKNWEYIELQLIGL